MATKFSLAPDPGLGASQPLPNGTKLKWSGRWWYPTEGGTYQDLPPPEVGYPGTQLVILNFNNLASPTEFINEVPNGPKFVRTYHNVGAPTAKQIAGGLSTGAGQLYGDSASPNEQQGLRSEGGISLPVEFCIEAHFKPPTIEYDESNGIVFCVGHYGAPVSGFLSLENNEAETYLVAPANDGGPFATLNIPELAKGQPMSHFALCRDENYTLRLWVNGTLRYEGLNERDIAGQIGILNSPIGGFAQERGTMDRFILTVDHPVYTAPFVPPTAEIAYVGSPTTGFVQKTAIMPWTPAGTSVLTLNFPTGCTPGNTLILCMGSVDAPVVSVTTNLGQALFLHGAYPTATGPSATLVANAQIWSAFNIPSGVTSIKVQASTNMSNFLGNMVAMEYYGITQVETYAADSSPAIVTNGFPNPETNNTPMQLSATGFYSTGNNVAVFCASLSSNVVEQNLAWVQPPGFEEIGATGNSQDYYCIMAGFKEHADVVTYDNPIITNGFDYHYGMRGVMVVFRRNLPT